MWDDLLAALALVFVFEGLMPFVSPATLRRTLARVEGLGVRHLFRDVAAGKLDPSRARCALRRHAKSAPQAAPHW